MIHLHMHVSPNKNIFNYNTTKKEIQKWMYSTSIQKIREKTGL